MHMKAAVENIITRTAAHLAYPRGQHLCITCGRYIRRFCAVGIEMTDGDYYRDMVCQVFSKLDKSADFCVTGFVSLLL